MKPNSNLPPSLKRRHLWPEADKQEFIQRQGLDEIRIVVVWSEDDLNDDDEIVKVVEWPEDD